MTKSKSIDRHSGSYLRLPSKGGKALVNLRVNREDITEIKNILKIIIKLLNNNKSIYMNARHLRSVL